MEKAEHYATMAVRAEPHNQSSLDTYAWIKFRQKDYKTAREFIDKAISEFGVQGTPDEWMANIEAADSASVVPEVADSIPAEYIDEDSTLIDDDDDEGYSSIEDIANSMGAELLEHAGDIYFMTGEPEVALQYWKLALSQSEDNELLKKKVKHKTYFFK
jgi:tetratricopeptide (TPR) repeat protein